MKKFILHILLFSLFTTLFYLIVLFFWGQKMSEYYKPNLKYNKGLYGHTYSRLAEVKTVKNVDILFLDSSHAYRGFDPRIFAESGYNSFNLGSSAQSPLQTKVLLQRYLDQLEPQLVVYEVYPETFTIDGVEAALDLVANDANDRFSSIMVLKSKHMKVLNSFLYSNMQNLAHRNESYKEQKQKYGDSYVSGGYVEKEMAYFSPGDTRKKYWVFDEAQEVAFQEILDILGEKDLRVVFVYAPITKNLKNSYQNNRDFQELITSYKYPYYDFNELIEMNDSLHFYDDNHLNQRGVELFNQALMETLRNVAGLLPSSD